MDDQMIVSRKIQGVTHFELDYDSYRRMAISQQNSRFYMLFKPILV